ncbi:class I SAM-dependent methyltransferase [Hyphomonas sp. UBA1474]|nr:class I SAM-dependent methyltransferase [Hyphomonas sp. UBA1474]
MAGDADSYQYLVESIRKFPDTGRLPQRNRSIQAFLV